MASAEHLEILRQGGDAWNEWRKENRGIRPDLSGEDFGYAELGGVDFSGMDFSYENLSSATLIGANLDRRDFHRRRRADR